jgi:hypothetical protein
MPVHVLTSAAIPRTQISNRLEIPVYVQGHLARSPAESRRYWLDLQPHDGPFEKYDMTFNGAVSTRTPTTSPGRYAGYDNGWILSLISVPVLEFDKSIVDFPNIKRFPGGASNDMSPDLQHPDNPVPLMDIKRVVQTIGAAD